jgi:uncharacterized protein YkwD
MRMRSSLGLSVLVALAALASASCSGGGTQTPAGRSTTALGAGGPSGTSPPAAAPRSADSEATSSAPAGRMAAIVAAHDQLRARHCAPPLAWSPALAQVAQQWAETLAARECAFEHNPDVEYGENLAFFAPVGSMSPEAIAQGWYDEIRAYRFDRPGFSMQTGHFTQLVWASTTEIGCGAVTCGDGEIWVCNYAPPGNVMGEFPENVRPTSCAR